MASPSFRDVSLVQLRYFVAAAERSSMTAAAEQLFVAQSAISASMANLEAALGTQLFVRRRARGLQLTAQGAELLPRARAVLAAVDDAVLSLHPENAAGRVSVGCFRTLAPFYLPDIISGLADSHPLLQVDVLELTAEGVETALVDQAIELAFTYDLGLSPLVEREVLASIPLYAAVASDHPLAAQTHVSLAELVDVPMVLLDMPFSRDYFLSCFSSLGLHPHVRYRFASFEAVRAMVARGHGFTLLNQQPKAASTYAGGELRHLVISDPVAPLELVLARRADSLPLTRRGSIVAEQCRAVVAAQGSAAQGPAAQESAAQGLAADGSAAHAPAAERSHSE